MKTADSLRIESLNLSPSPGNKVVLQHAASASSSSSSAADKDGLNCVVAEQKNHVFKSRKRSQSVATGQPSVETVMVKAKRAATSLWMLLHAQVSLPFGL